MWLFFLILVIFSLFSIRKRKNDREPLDHKSTTCIKGILCFFVLLHNIGLDFDTSDTLMRTIDEHAGGVAVGLFFMLSMYGIVKSYIEKGEPFLKKILFKNIPRIYSLSVIVNIITYICYPTIITNKTEAILKIFNFDFLYGFTRMNRHGWFILTLLFLYIIFVFIYYIFKKCKNKNIPAIVFSVVIIAIDILSAIFHFGTYTREILCCLIGIFYATNYKYINLKIKKYFIPIICISILAFLPCFIYYEPVAAWASCLLIIALSQKIECDNKVNYFTGKMCIGIYLFQHFSMITMQSYINNIYSWVLSNFVFIIGLSVLLYLFDYYFWYFLNKTIELIKAKKKVKNSNEREK